MKLKSLTLTALLSLVAIASQAADGLISLAPQ